VKADLRQVVVLTMSRSHDGHQLADPWIVNGGGRVCLVSMRHKPHGVITERLMTLKTGRVVLRDKLADESWPGPLTSFTVNLKIVHG
jgi:hypothetical protein